MAEPSVDPRQDSVWTLVKRESRTAWTYVRDHMAVVVSALVALLAVVFAGRRATPTVGQRVAVQLDAIQARTDAARVLAEQGAEAAHAHVAARYDQQIRQLNERQAADAKALVDDPPALAAYLVRVGARGDAGGGTGVPPSASE